MSAPEAGAPTPGELLLNGDAVAVWISRDFVPEIMARSADGRFRLTATLGEPDERGVCSLIITRHEDDIVAAARAEGHAAGLEAAARAGLEAAARLCEKAAANGRAEASHQYSTRERLMPVILESAALAVEGAAFAIRALAAQPAVVSGGEQSRAGSNPATPPLPATGVDPDYRAEALAWRAMVDAESCKISGGPLRVRQEWLSASGIREHNEAIERASAPPQGDR